MMLNYTHRISRIRVGARVVSPRSVFLYGTEGEFRRATPPKLERRRVYFIFSMMIGIDLFSSALGTDPNLDSSEHPRHIIAAQNRNFIAALFTDKEKNYQLPEKICQLKEQKKKVISELEHLEGATNQLEGATNQLEGARKELPKLETDLSRSLHALKQNRFQFLISRQLSLQENINQSSQDVREMQKGILQLEEEITELQVKIVNEILFWSPDVKDIPLDREMIENWYQDENYQAKVQTIKKRLEKIINTPPCQVLRHIFNFLEEKRDYGAYGIRPIFPTIFDIRGVSKHWEKWANDFIREKNFLKVCPSCPQRPFQIGH
jgi:hypothetical protein